MQSVLLGPILKRNGETHVKNRGVCLDRMHHGHVRRGPSGNQSLDSRDGLADSLGGNLEGLKQLVEKFAVKV